MTHTATDTINRTARLHVSDEVPALLERLEAITPLINAHADENEELRELAPAVIDALHESGVFRTGIPVELGGYEASPRQVIEIIEKVAYADASAGWAVMALQMVTGTTAAYQGREATEALFGDGGYHLIAGQGTRLGTARSVEGGYTLTGSWQFASGLPHASHIHTAGLVEDTGEVRIFTFPKEQATVIDNWDVMGLKASGSIDYTTEDLFVPEAYTYIVSTKEPQYGGALYTVGLANMSGMNHAGWAFGVARRMLDELREYSHKKLGVPGAATSTSEFYADYARAEAKLRAARALVMEVWAENEAVLERGELLDVERESLTRLSLANATWSAHEVVTLAYKWAATTALRHGNMQRFFRDMNAGSQHLTSGPVVQQSVGKQLVGHAPGAQWVFFDLHEQAPDAS